MKKILLFALTILVCLILNAQDTYVFFGSYNHDKAKEGIYVYQLDTISGKLTKVTTVKNLLNPSYLTLSPDGKFVFSCTESRTPNAGSVSSFEFKPENKTLTFINSQKSGGENPVYLTVHKSGQWLINGNYTGGSLSVYPIAENGTIKPMVQNFFFTEDSINKEKPILSHIHSTVFSPNFDYIFFPDLGMDKIRAYQFENDKSRPLVLAEKSFTRTAPGSGPRHFTFHPNGKFAYCIEELSGTISVYKYAHGELDSIQRIKTHSDRYTKDLESADIHISPDGRYLYASNRGRQNNIAIFAIQMEGKLKLVGYQSTLGKHPRIFALDPSGKFLIATNLLSGNVVVFKRDSITGLLKKRGKKLKIKNVSCVKIRQY